MPRTRRRITVTVDPEMLEEIDTYIRDHAGMDRSRLVDEALRCWHDRTLHQAIMRQHSATKSAEEVEERLAWRRIRAAQSLRVQRKHQLGSESGL